MRIYDPGSHAAALRRAGRRWLRGLPLLCFFFLQSCSRKADITIFATAHSGDWLWKGRGGQSGGYATLRRIYELEKGPKLAVDLGNWLGETPEGYLTRGAAAAACMNAVPYSVSALGPEDLVLAPAELEKLAKAASFPVVASNLYLRDDKKPAFLKTHYIAALGGTRVGFLAVTIMDPAKFGVQRYLPNYKFEKESYEMERALRSLRNGGARVTVLLLVLNPRKPVPRDFYESFLKSAPRPDLIITDDPGLKKPKKHGKTWVAPVPHELAAAARIGLSIDPGTGRLSGVAAGIIELDKTRRGESPSVVSVIAEQRGTARRMLARRAGSAAAALKRSEGAASPLGDFTADCVRRWARSNAAIINNSVLGGDLAGGTVTTGDLYKVLPVDTSVVFVKIRGEDLKSAIENISGDISVSGMEIGFRGAGIEKLEIEGEPVRPGRIYRIAVPDAIVTDQDFSLLASATEFANSRRSLREVLGWCFSRRTVPPGPDRKRITRED